MLSLKLSDVDCFAASFTIVEHGVAVKQVFVYGFAVSFVI